MAHLLRLCLNENNFSSFSISFPPYVSCSWSDTRQTPYSEQDMLNTWDAVIAMEDLSLENQFTRPRQVVVDTLYKTKVITTFY